jgi:hypothetical protein
MEAGTDRDPERGGVVSQALELPDRGHGDAGDGPAPARMEERARRSVVGEDRHRGTVRRGDRDPRIAAAHQEAVRRGGRLAGKDDAPAVLLMDPERLVRPEAERGAHAGAVLLHAGVRIPHREAEIERGETAGADSAKARRQAEPDARRERVARRAPEREAVGVGVPSGHGRQGDRSFACLQAICARLAIGALFLAAGCAHVPSGRGDAEVRARLLAWADAGLAPARGEGVVSFVRGGRRAGSAEVRWVSVAESLAVVASVGPVRVMQGTLRGDSVALALRHADLEVSGALGSAGIGSARIARFLFEPWRFGGPAMRDALVRAEIDPLEDGFRLRGELAPEDSSRRFELRLSPRGDPRSLTLVLGLSAGDTLSVRYGKPRTYAAGILPRWVEWSWGRNRARLEVETHSSVEPSRVRLAVRPEPGDTLLALEDPRGRRLLKRLFGLGDGEEAP